jgi:hypothetical protein
MWVCEGAPLFRRVHAVARSTYSFVMFFCLSSQRGSHWMGIRDVLGRLTKICRGSLSLVKNPTKISENLREDFKWVVRFVTEHTNASQTIFVQHWMCVQRWKWHVMQQNKYYAPLFSIAMMIARKRHIVTLYVHAYPVCFENGSQRHLNRSQRHLNYSQRHLNRSQRHLNRSHIHLIAVRDT